MTNRHPAERLRSVSHPQAPQTESQNEIYVDMVDPYEQLQARG